MKTFLPILALITATLFSGCTVAQFSRSGNQSHFDYPNSNVEPVGPVAVKASGPGGFGSPPFLTADEESALFDNAIGQVSGADMLINYSYLMKVKKLPILPIYFSDFELEATAAKATVGRQNLR